MQLPACNAEMAAACVGSLPAVLDGKWPAAGAPCAAAEEAAATLAAATDLVALILVTARDATTLARAACVCPHWRVAAAPALAALHAGTWHPLYLQRWWSRAAAAA